MSGKLIVIESGSDASGKATQSKKLVERLKNEGYNVMKVEFPDYKSDSSALIKMYLNGEFGKNPHDVNPYAASAFYGVDRFASYKKTWKDFYESGGIIIADRYTTSNMVHQASKISDAEEKERYLDWLWDFEFEKIGIPVPDAVIFLNMPPEISMELAKDRENKITGDKTKDIHEADREYLINTYNNAVHIAEKYSWSYVECCTGNILRTIDDIHEDVYQKVIRII